MKKNAPTLADFLYRESFRNELQAGWTSNSLWRDALRRARKFVLDDEMSTFLGELGTAAFVREKLSANAKIKVAEHLRMGARLPAEITWIEYNLQKCQTRSGELLKRPVTDLDAMPEREGWLLMRHPLIETAFKAHIVSQENVRGPPGGAAEEVWTFPVALAWTADTDSTIPWRSIQFDHTSAQPSEVSTGLLGYRTDRCGFVYSDMITTPNNPEAIATLISEWTGVQRRMWALLSTINDLPVQLTEVRAQRGFMAKGAYRKFLDHRTVTLTIPTKQYTKVIRTALAQAHRRGGPVREHWRKDWRRPLSVLCDHEWDADEKHMFCKHCKGRKIWVIEHVRGDTTKGFVTHDYLVTHNPDDE